MEWGTILGIVGGIITYWWSKIRSAIVWPFKAISRLQNRRKGWPLITNVEGHTDRPMYGRKEQLKQLRAILVEGNPAALTDQRKGAAAISGQGGVGKTRLAHAYIEEYANHYETIWYVKAENLISAHEELALLGLRIDCRNEDNIPPDKNAVAVLHKLALREALALIVYDNVVKPQDIAPLRISPGKIHYLITSRHPGDQEDWAGVARSIPLGTLDPDDAVKLLKEQSGRDGEDLEGLAKDLGYLALALVIAAKRLKNEEALTVAAYREKNLERYLHVKLGEAEYDRSVYGAVMESYDRISPEAQALLHLLAFLGSDDLSISLVGWLGNNAYPEPLKQAAQDTATLSPLFSILHDAGLVEPVEGTQGEAWTVHRLTQAVVRSRLKQDEAYDTWATAAAQLVLATLPADPVNPENWPKFASMQPHVEALLHHGPETGDGGKALNSDMHRIGYYLSVRGDAAGSLPYGEKSQALSKALYGEESEPHATALNQLGATNDTLGNFGEAETLLQRALRIDRKMLPKDHPDLATHLNNLASVHKRLEKFIDAENEQKEALRIVEAAFGNDSPIVADHLDNLGVFYSEQDQKEKSWPFTERALDIRRAAPGELHQSTARSYHNSAHMEVNRGNAEKALNYAMRAVAILHHLGIEGGLAVSLKAFLIQLLQTSGQDQQADALREGDFSSLDRLIEQLKREHEEGRTQRDDRIAAIIADMQEMADKADFDGTALIARAASGSGNAELDRQILIDAIRKRDDAAEEEPPIPDSA